MALTIALVAGEASGDNLGAPLIRAIKQARPDARFIGIGGTGMIAAGLTSYFDMERLSVNGFVDPIKRLPELLNILLTTRDRIVEAGADCYVGVDFNFFNLLLERMLRKRGIKTVHYVSPTVWAWRRWRIKGIRKSVDLMLTLYPFETAIYDENGIDVAFVGHPRADEIDPDEGEAGKQAARDHFGYASADRVIAILPGSRASEVKFSGPDFLKAAAIVDRRIGPVKYIVPAANPKRRMQIEHLIDTLDIDIDIRLVDGDSMRAMQAADAVLVNSGTATLEAMLLKRPMVMSYRLGAMTYALVSRMVTTEYFALPNILAGEALVPEFIQNDATPEALATALLAQLDNPDREALMDAFDRIHETLRCNAGEQSARAVLAVCDRAASVGA